MIFVPGGFGYGEYMEIYRTWITDFYYQGNITSPKNKCLLTLCSVHV